MRLYINTLTDNTTRSGLTRSIHFRLTDDEYNQLEQLAKSEHRKVSDMIRYILAQYVAQEPTIIRETSKPYPNTPSDSDIQAAVEAATRSAVKEVMDKLRR